MVLIDKDLLIELWTVMLHYVKLCLFLLRRCSSYWTECCHIYLGFVCANSMPPYVWFVFVGLASSFLQILWMNYSTALSIMLSISILHIYSTFKLNASSFETSLWGLLWQCITFFKKDLCQVFVEFVDLGHGQTSSTCCTHQSIYTHKGRQKELCT